MKSRLLTVFFLMLAFVKGGIAEPKNSTFTETQNGITTEYTIYITSSDWREANETCQTKGGQLYCSNSKTHCELPRGIYDTLKVLHLQMWLQRLDCSKPSTVGLYLHVTNDTGSNNFMYEHHFEKGTQKLPFTCMRQITANPTVPPVNFVSVRNVTCRGLKTRNIVWPITFGNTKVERNCPNGRIGKAEWFCSKEGIWTPENPDLSECYNPKFNSMYETIGVTELVQTIKELEQLLKEIDSLFGGSLKMAVEILETVDDVSRSHMATMDTIEKQDFVGKVTNGVVATCDQILKTTSAWDDLPQNEKNDTANQFLSAVDETASLLSIKIQNSGKEVISSDSIALEVHKRPKGFFHNQNLTFSYGGEHRQNQTLGQVTLTSGFEQYGRNNGTEVYFSWYSDLRHVLPENAHRMEDGVENLTLNTAVVSANVSGIKPHQTMNLRVVILLEHIEHEATNPTCVFWNGARWSQQDCTRLETNRTHTSCQCNHLTNFAVLMDVRCINCDAAAGHKLALSIVSNIGCFISIFFLSITIFIFTWYRALWGVRTTIHRNLCISLLLAQIILLAGLTSTEDSTICAVIAGLLHYFFLAVFFWMFLEAIQILLLLIQVFTSDDMKKYPYYLVGYGCPALIVGITAGARTSDFGGPEYCWLQPEPNGTIWAYLGPVAVILLFNTLTFAYALWMTHRITKNFKNGSDNLKLWVRGSAVLMPILGLTWSVGFVYLITDSMAIPYIFTVLNSIQGLLIFIFHCLLNKKVQHLINHTVRRHHTQSVNITRSHSSSKESRASDRSKFWLRKPSIPKPSVLSDATPVTLLAIDPEDELPKADTTEETKNEMEEKTEEIEPTETTTLKQHVDT